MSQITVGMTEEAVNEQLMAVRERTSFERSSDDVPPDSGGLDFDLTYDVEARLTGGSIDFRPGEVKIDELDVTWTRLELGFSVDIPELCVGGGSVSILGVEISLPQACIFSPDPDLSVSMDLSDVITHELSLLTGFGVEYFRHPARLADPSMDDLTALENDVSNEWRLTLDDPIVDLDVIDFADTVTNVFERMFRDGIEAILEATLPDAVADVISVDALLDEVFDTVRDILDVGDDIGEWLEDDILRGAIGVGDWIVSLVVELYSQLNPISIQDPYPVLPRQSRRVAPDRMASLRPVLIPVARPTIDVTEDELTIRMGWQ